MSVTIGSGGAQTITFGTGTGQVATLAQLQTAIQGLTGATASVNTANGDISIAATDPTAGITIGGTASAAKFGIETLSALPANDTVIGNDVTTFTAESTDGGSITTYDSEGNPVNVQFRWAEVSSASGSNSWQLFYQTNSNATGTEAAWQNVGTTFTFNSNGELTPPIASLTLPNLTVNGDSLGNVQLALGANGLTQFADTNGTVQVNQLEQNGYSVRSTAIGRGRQPGPHHRFVLERADHSAGGNPAGDVQRRGFLAVAQRRRFRVDARFGAADLRRHRHHHRKFARSLQRRHRHPVQSADRGAAGLFGQCQSHVDRRPDDPKPAASDPVRAFRERLGRQP